MKQMILAGLVCSIALPAWSDLVVRFDEGAPKDRFVVENAGTCDLSGVSVKIDLGKSAAGLVFDVTEKGAGVSVYQPLDIVAGAALLAVVPTIEDGDTAISLTVPEFGAQDVIAFTIDVDDTKGVSPTRVSGAEITGAQVTLQTAGTEIHADFTAAAVARVPLSACNA